MLVVEQNPGGVATQALNDSLQGANEERRREGAYQAALAESKQRTLLDAARLGFATKAQQEADALKPVAGEAASFQAGLSRPTDVPEDPQRRYAVELAQRQDIAKRLAAISPEHAQRFIEETRSELEDRMTSEGLDALKAQIHRRSEIDNSIPGLGEGPLDARPQYDELAGMLDAAKALPPPQRAQALAVAESHYQAVLKAREESQKHIAAVSGRAQAWQAVAAQRRATGDHFTADAIDAIAAKMLNDPLADPSEFDLPFAAAQAGPKAAAQLEQMQQQNANLQATLARIQAQTAQAEEATRASKFEHSIAGKIAGGIGQRLGKVPQKNGAAKALTPVDRAKAELAAKELTDAYFSEGKRTDKNAKEYDATLEQKKVDLGLKDTPGGAKPEAAPASKPSEGLSAEQQATLQAEINSGKIKTQEDYARRKAQILGGK